MALLTPVVAVGPTVKPVAAVFFSNCTVGPDNNYHGFIWHSAGSNYNSMYAEVVYLRDTSTCTTFAGQKGASFALPVNLQPDNWNDFFQAFVQLGYGHLESGAPLKFLYTGVDSISGTLIEAPASVETPEIGNKYGFRIEWVPSQSKWLYSIQDYTDGQAWTWYGPTTDRDYARYLWAGFEVYDNNDQFGGNGTWLTINNIWLMVEGSPTIHYWSNKTYAETGIKCQYWNGYTSNDANGRAFVRGMTANHSGGTPC